MTDQTPPDLEAEIRQLIAQRKIQQQNSRRTENDFASVQDYFELRGAALESARVLKLLQRVQISVESVQRSVAELVAVDHEEKDRVIQQLTSSLDHATGRLKFLVEFAQQTMSAGAPSCFSHEQAVELWRAMQRAYIDQQEQPKE